MGAKTSKLDGLEMRSEKIRLENECRCMILCKINSIAKKLHETNQNAVAISWCLRLTASIAATGSQPKRNAQDLAKLWTNTYLFPCEATCALFAEQRRLARCGPSSVK